MDRYQLLNPIRGFLQACKRLRAHARSAVLSDRARRAASHANLALALHFAQEAVLAAPAYPDAQMMLGYVHFRLSDFAQAKIALEEAVKLSPHHRSPYFYLGMTEDRLGNVKAAEAALRQALELAPNDADTLTWLGGTMAKQQRWSEARVLFDRSLAVRPGDAHTLAAAGEMACRLDDFAAAATRLRKSVGIDGTKPVPQFYLGVSLDRLDQHAEAREHARRAVELAADNEEFRQFLNYLENRPRLDEFSRIWKTYLASPEARQPLRMTVAEVDEVHDRGVTIRGPLEAGFPRKVTAVIELNETILRTIDVTGADVDSRPPQIAIFLAGLRRADVPLGARIRSISEGSPD